MAFTKMAFDPAEGLKDTEKYPSTPASEDEARAQIQGRLDEIRDYLNDTLTAELQNAETGTSGAERIGSAAIENVNGTTVRAQIADLKGQIDDISAGSVADGTITEAKLADEAVTEDKLAADAVTTPKIADGAVTADKLAAGALDGANLVDASVSGDKIAIDAVGPAKIAYNAVTETKIGTGAVTVTKIGAEAVTAVKLGADAVETVKIKDGAVTNSKIGNGAVTAAKLGTIASLTLASDAYVYYSSGRWMLHVNGYTEVQLAPVKFGTEETPAGTYPVGTIYIRYQA